MSEFVRWRRQLLLNRLPVDRGLLSLVFSILFLASCSRPVAQYASHAPVDHAHFEEVAERSGLDFVHDNGRRGQFYMPEIMGSGGALLDYDNDGDMDVFLCQGFPLGSESRNEGGRLFRNELNQKSELTFTDITQQSRIITSEYGMGAAVGDVNNDGHVDLYLTNLGNNQLWLNRGDGTFQDITAEAGADDTRWSVSAAFLDYDHDGWLDLFIGNYVNFTLENHRDCFRGQKDYCDPESYEPHPDRLLRNRGDGTFEDVTATSGILTAYGSALGVVTADLNDDGWIDLYVANDGNVNQCWINQKNGTFVDAALISGCALNHSGMAEAGMGVDAADFDGDGDEDLFVTHLATQTNTIYVNQGSGYFVDQTDQSGLGFPSTPFTGFGTAWFDYDNDGRLDIVCVNGGVTAIAELTDDPFPYHQVNQLFHNLGDGRFEDVSDKAGFKHSEVSRGAMFGDIDSDGDLDVVISNNGGRARLLLNRKGSANGWIGLIVRDPAWNRYAVGALVTIQIGAKQFTRRVSRTGSYASARDPRLVVGLGQAEGNCTVRVQWRGGGTERWDDLRPKQWHTIQRGEGTSNSDGR